MSDSLWPHGLQPGFPVFRHLPEFAQAHVRWVDEAARPSHPLPPSSPFAFKLCQHQDFLALPYDPSTYTPSFWPKRNESICPLRNLGVKTHSGLIHKRQNLKAAWMSIHWGAWINKMDVVHPYSGELSNCKKERNTNTCQGMGEPWDIMEITESNHKGPGVLCFHSQEKSRRQIHADKR